MLQIRERIDNLPCSKLPSQLESQPMRCLSFTFIFLFAYGFWCSPASAAPSQGDSNSPSLVIFEALRQAVEDNYPVLEFVGWQGNRWNPEFRAKIAAAPTSEAAFQLMDEYVCRLNDYHTRLSWPGKPSLATPACQLEPVLIATNPPPDHGIWAKMRPPVELPPINGISIAVLQAEKETGLQAGDEILSVDGVHIIDALARAWRHSVGCSVGGKLLSATSRILQGPADREVQIEVRRQVAHGRGELLTLTVPRSTNVVHRVVSTREVESVPVIRIPRWANDGDHNLVNDFDKALDAARKSPGLIIDVRKNGGGQDEIADQIIGRFIKAPVFSSDSFARLVPGKTYERRLFITEPRGPWRYEGRVAVLTDEGCMSACEHFVSGMIEAGALTCGTPTSGAGGWIRTVPLPGGVRLNISRTFPLHTGGIPSPQLGIAPHLWAPRTLAEVRAGEDTALRTALRWIKSGDPLPLRLQPVAPFSQNE